MSEPENNESALRRCSVFLTPAHKERPYLEALMGEACAKLDLPSFEPHVTVYSGIFPDPDFVCRALVGITAGLPPLTLKARGIGFSPEYFKTLFIVFEENELLRAIHERLKAVCGTPSGYELAPHLSLLYADLPLREKEILTHGIHLDRLEFRFDEVKLVTPLNQTEGWRDTGRWHTLGHVKLAETKLKAVLFDFGGVLATEGFHEGLMTVAQRQGLDPVMVHRVGMDAIYDSGYITGQASEAEFWAMMREKSGIMGTDSELTNEIIDHFAIRPKMIEAVRRLQQKGFVTAILSDQTDWLEKLDRRDHFFGEFDRVYNSFHLGKGKRDPSIFTDVAADLGISPYEAFFVDDMEGNVERAISRGMRGMLFTDEERFLTELEQLLTKQN